MAPGTGSTCGACKFLRRRCSTECVFAPYFSSEQGPARFAAIHKVFGASNVSKLLLHVPAHERCEAVVTVAYEAQARVRDPVYGCLAHIFALQHQVAVLQAELIQARVKMAQSVGGCTTARGPSSLFAVLCAVHVSKLGWVGSSRDVLQRGQAGNRRAPHSELGELEALAQRMMRN